MDGCVWAGKASDAAKSCLIVAGIVAAKWYFARWYLAAGYLLAEYPVAWGCSLSRFLCPTLGLSSSQYDVLGIEKCHRKHGQVCATNAWRP